MFCCIYITLHFVEIAFTSVKGGVQMYVTVLKKMRCSDLETLFINCKHFYSLREFCSFILVSVYIPPQANASLALQKLTDQTTETEHLHRTLF